MDQQQTQQADGEPDDAAGDDGAQPRAERLKTVGLWCALLAVSTALLGGSLMMWHSLQADKAISQVARSAMQKMAPPVAMPPMAAQPVAAAASAHSGERASLADEPASAAAVAAGPGPVAAQALSDGTPSGAASTVRMRAPVVKTGGKTALQAKRASVRSKALARARLRTEGRVRARTLAAASVQQRLNSCKEKAGEAAAACYARACRSYARNAAICINDEPTRRRR